MADLISFNADLGVFSALLAVAYMTAIALGNFRFR